MDISNMESKSDYQGNFDNQSNEDNKSFDVKDEYQESHVEYSEADVAGDEQFKLGQPNLSYDITENNLNSQHDEAESSQIDQPIFKEESQNAQEDKSTTEEARDYNSNNIARRHSDNNNSPGLNETNSASVTSKPDSIKKRKYDEENGNRNSSSKRSNNSSSSSTSSKSSTGENEVYLKLLIPASAAGGVIGRGGEKIAQIQKDACVKMKMSKANDYYPNTNERVCLIIGTIRAVLKAHDLIVERIQEKPDSSNRSQVDRENEERVNQIKILIPNSTAGLLIGKAGTYIKQIKDDSGAFVQISSKQTDLPERIVTIEGEMEKRNKALELVVKKIAEDPQHNSVTNLNYSDMHSSSGNIQGQNANGGMSQNGSASGGQNNKFDFNSVANYLAGLNNLALLIINCGGSYQMSAESLRNALRSSGYSANAIIEIIDAITILMSYGLITKVAPVNNMSTGFGINNLLSMALSTANAGGMSGGGGGNNHQQHHANNHHGHHQSYGQNSHHSHHSHHHHQSQQNQQMNGAGNMFQHLLNGSVSKVNTSR
jgi:ribosomal protein S3